MTGAPRCLPCSGAFVWRRRPHEVFLLLACLAACNGGTAVSPPASTVPKSKRIILNFDGAETQEGRLELLKRVRDDGYACWLVASTFSAAVCLQNDINAASIPESAADLRSILWRVNLKAWLPSVLCLSTGDTPIPSSGTRSQDERGCIEVVEEAFQGSELVNASVVVTVGGDRIITRAAIDETPWVQAMARCLEPDFAARVAPHECRNLYTTLASERGKSHLLPALETLARNADAARTAPSSSTLAPGKKRFLPSAENIEKLLSTFHSYRETPSLHMLQPKHGGRISGSAVAFVAQYALGTALGARLAEGLGRPSIGKGAEPEQVMSLAGNCERELTTTTRLEEHESGNATIGGCSWSAPATQTADQPPAGGEHEDDIRRHRREEVVTRLPPLERCEVAFLVGGVAALRLPLNAEETGDGTVMRAVAPAYLPRCSEHPLQTAAAAAAKTGGNGGGGWHWESSEDTYSLEPRSIERVCTDESFGPHLAHAELSCCTSGVTGVSAYDEATTAAGDTATTRSTCEVFAKTDPVEYFHTGNGADVYSSWGKEKAEEEEEDNGSGGEGGAGQPLLDPPPEDISVLLYLENARDTLRTTVSVPRWSSDGEVWEAAYRACLQTFNPGQAVMTSNNDCVHLATTAIKAKRVDLYNRMFLRLDAYLSSMDPNFAFEGHTGHNPEKVEALGAMARDGGERVGMVCEVGFNAGHSSLNWLLSSPPTAKVLAFDIGLHGYVEHALAFLQAVFPGRFGLVIGDSAVTVPAYVAAERREGRDPRACDVLFVDGSHSEEGAYTDLINFQKIASRGWHAFAIDDMDMYPVSTAWRRFRDEGRGRLVDVVESTAEIYTRMEEIEGADGDLSWNAHIEGNSYRYFTQHGFFSLGIGYLRSPPYLETQDP